MRYRVEVVFDEEYADTPEEAADIVMRWIKENWPGEPVKCTVIPEDGVYQPVEVMADGETVLSGPR